ncbi:DUF6146 family protein [Flavobacterium kingsejongi]|uniref:Lipoprotein n=1 Tax=Flavobacterium kingsejongi TaxID=1678728 RepID=A0A2S1LUH9_9FLAO|nr:DUF6146 family protein [Flavobacterium kingsejongi]AWG27374.1 hypothetical protein FK004_16290 [Flavobacterium kingsejongi]
MKNIVFASIIILLAISCGSHNTTQFASSGSTNDTIKIANDSIGYEVIIIEPGFNSYINSIARPRGYYSQNYLENKNQLWVREWNSRVNQPFRYDPNLYEMQIDYNAGTDYGYEVNYLLYNYLVYFQNKYKQSLFGFVPHN